MTVFRLISPAFRSGLLTASGTGLIVAPLFLGLAPAAIVTGMVVGAVAVALALAGTDADRRGTLPLSAQAVYDRGLALGVMVTALIFGLAGEPGAALGFAVAGLGALAVTAITRYSARPA
jgi:energy-converting hydrogenase Eha subunit A